jgi:hypothetical protein
MALKLYVWEDALEDWGTGAIFVIANNIAEARKLAGEQSIQARRDVKAKPRVLNLNTAKPEAWLCWGSG